MTHTDLAETEWPPPVVLTEEDEDDRAFFMERYFIRSPDLAERTTARVFISISMVLVVVCAILIINDWPSTTSSDGFATSSSESPGAGTGFGILALIAAIYVGVKGFRRLSVYGDKYACAEPKPDDEYVDAFLAEDLEQLREEAAQTVGVPSDLIRSGPFCLVGPALPAYGAFAEDGTHRYSRYEVVFLYVTQYNVVAHTCVYDFIHGRQLLIQVREYAFRDIISVDTVKLPMGAAARKQEYFIPDAPLAGEPIWRLGEDAMRPVHLFRIGIASGERIQANIADMADAPELHSDMEPVNAHNLARAIRSVLREHSGGIIDEAGPADHHLPPLPNQPINP